MMASTPHHIVAQMLKLGRVGAADVVYDLGCGDGRIVIAAAKLGARGVCVDIDPQRIRESRANAERAGVAERIRFLNQDLFETAIGEATVVTLFLWQSVNERLRPHGPRKLFLWIIPTNTGDRARGIRPPGFLFAAA